jgi:hypothetical protein
LQPLLTEHHVKMRVWHGECGGVAFAPFDMRSRTLLGKLTRHSEHARVQIHAQHASCSANTLGSHPRDNAGPTRNIHNTVTSHQRRSLD